MKLKTKLSSSADRGGFGLEFPGTCHLIITAIDPEPRRKTGESINGLQVTVGVLASTEPRNVGRSCEVILTYPSDSNNDGGEFLRRVQTRFLHVTCLVEDSQLDQEVEVDLDLAVGRQFVAKFAEEEYRGKTSVKLKGDDMWHVDDPYCENIPKDAAAIVTIPVSLRRQKSSPPATTAKAAAKTNPKKPLTTQPPKTTEFSEPVKSDDVDLDNL